MCYIMAAGLALSAAAKAYSVSSTRSLAKSNSAFARRDAEQAQEVGRFNEQRARSRMDRLISQQRGQLVERGVRLDSVSAQSLGQRAGEEGGLEAQAQRFNTSAQVDSRTHEASISKFRGSSIALGKTLGAGADLLTGSLQIWPGLAGAGGQGQVA